VFVAHPLSPGDEPRLPPHLLRRAPCEPRRRWLLAHSLALLFSLDPWDRYRGEEKATASSATSHEMRPVLPFSDILRNWEEAPITSCSYSMKKEKENKKREFREKISEPFCGLVSGEEELADPAKRSARRMGNQQRWKREESARVRAAGSCQVAGAKGATLAPRSRSTMWRRLAAIEAAGSGGVIGAACGAGLSGRRHGARVRDQDLC